MFTRLTPRIDLDVQYKLRGGSPDEAPGSLTLNARLSGSNGWQRVLPLADAEPLRSGQSRLRTTLDLVDLESQLATVEERTSAAEGSYRLELLPLVQDGAEATKLTFAPAITFRLQAGQLVLEATGHERGLPLTQSTTAATQQAGATQARLQAFGLSVPASSVRLAGALLAVLGLALGGAGLVRRRADPLARLDRPVVPVTAQELTRPALEIGSLNALLDLAQRYDRPVLHVSSADGPVYMVEEGGTWYRHMPHHDQARKRA